MAIIKDYMDGSCRIIVHDDYIRPKEEVQEIIDRVSRIVLGEELRRNTLKKQEHNDVQKKTV